MLETPNTQGPFIIVRYPLAVGIKQMVRFIQNLPPDPSRKSFIVFKLYRNNMQGETSKLSQMGHIVSFAIIGSQIAFIDPQGKTFKQIDNISTFDIYHMGALYYGFQFVDIIFTWYKMFPIMEPVYDGGSINVRLPEITYGGSRKHKHTRKNNKKN